MVNFHVFQLLLLVDGLSWSLHWCDGEVAWVHCSLFSDFLEDWCLWFRVFRLSVQKFGDSVSFFSCQFLFFQFLLLVKIIFNLINALNSSSNFLVELEKNSLAHLSSIHLCISFEFLLLSNELSNILI